VAPLFQKIGPEQRRPDKPNFAKGE
jgi:hypothetical protein